MIRYIATFIAGIYIGQEYKIPNIKKTILEIVDKIEKK
jgi:hypothetical protein